MVLGGQIDRKDGVARIFSHNPPVNIPELNLHLATVFDLSQHRQRPEMTSRITQLTSDQLPELPSVFRKVYVHLRHRCLRLMRRPLIVCSLPESQDSSPLGRINRTTSTVKGFSDLSHPTLMLDSSNPQTLIRKVLHKKRPSLSNSASITTNLL